MLDEYLLIELFRLRVEIDSLFLVIGHSIDMNIKQINLFVNCIR